MKTILTLTGGFYLFPESIPYDNLAANFGGIVLALIGMVNLASGINNNSLQVLYSDIKSSGTERPTMLQRLLPAKAEMLGKQV
jgi:hypothetical protein